MRQASITIENYTEDDSSLSNMPEFNDSDTPNE